MYQQGQGLMSSIDKGYSERDAAIQQVANQRREVGAEMDGLASAVDLLGVTVGLLIDRLNPVLNRCATDEKACTEDPQPVLCLHADAIRSQRQLVVAARNMLRRALDELEL